MSLQRNFLKKNLLYHISWLYRKIYKKHKINNGIQNAEKSLDDYSLMQKTHYENQNIASEQIVGNYEWHENFPYETFLLNKYGDMRYPIFNSLDDKVALDFGCGPGRMVKRMKKLFRKVDGCDISQRLLYEAKEVNPESDFYVTDGKDLGATPKKYYDFIYCTISMQHIACYSIRFKIIQNMKEALKKDGCITLQMGYNKDFPYTCEERSIINDKLVIIKCKANQANYFEDVVTAEGTNGRYDVGIGVNDLKNVKDDFLKIFDNVEIWFANTDNYYSDLKGSQHTTNYWAKDWVFIHAY